MEETDKQTQNDTAEIVTPDIMRKIILDMIINPSKLQTGYELFSKIETCKGFYISLINVTLHPESKPNEIKLAASVASNFLRKNWSDDNFITIEEKLEIFLTLTNNIHHEDYFLTNFIAKLLGIISAKEWPNSYEVIIKKIVKGLIDSTNNPKNTETYLRIMSSILYECDDRISQMTSELLPVIVDVFKNSTKSQKNREKCLKIITQILNKLSFADGTDPDLVAKSLDSNKCMENCFSLIISIIVSTPKSLFDIKKYAIKTLDILVRDMPIYSQGIFSEFIEPAWKVIVQELALYTQKVIFNKELEYSEFEIAKIKEEGYEYTRGYESDDEEEVYGMEGFIMELIDFAVDLLKRNGVVLLLQDNLLTLFLCLKCYCLMPQNNYILWKDDPNLFISEEYDDENVNSIRNKSINLIKEVSKDLDLSGNELALKFIKIILSEFSEGLNPENYLEVIKLDDYNYMIPYFEKMNTDNNYIIRRHEANLLLLGSFAEDLMTLKETNYITKENIDELLCFLFKIVNGELGKNTFLIGRALWCISKLFSLFRNDTKAMMQILDCVASSMNNNQVDLTIDLIAAQCLTQIGEKLPKTEVINPKALEPIFLKLIALLDHTTEDTISFPLDCIISLSKLNKEAAIIVPAKASKAIINLYSENYNHPTLGNKILQLIRIWCEDPRCSNLMINLFVPFSMCVFDDFFKTLKNSNNKGFEEVKRTVITEHAGGDMDFKTNLEMLPVSHLFLI